MASAHTKWILRDDLLSLQLATCLVYLIRSTFLIFPSRHNRIAGVTNMQPGRIDERMMNCLLPVIAKKRKGP